MDVEPTSVDASELPAVRAPQPHGSVEHQEQVTLSVVIPYYRGADVIREAVESALEQTLPPDEIVICDDGSPDDLEVALGELAARITIVRKQNGGAASAMNTAARSARGEYLVQLDQDDVFEPRRLEAIAAVAVARPDLDIVATDALIECDGKTIARFSEKFPFETDTQRTAILCRCIFAWPAIRRSLLLDVGGYDESFTTAYDLDCFMRLIYQGARAAFIDEPLYRWRLSSFSMSSDGRRNAEAHIRALEKIKSSGRLDDRERRVAESVIASQRATIVRMNAHLALEERRSDARRRSLKLVFGRDFNLATRAKATLAIVSPPLARRLLARRAARDPSGAILARRG
jgi:glycosyltransferase involved in cell wall biosynthesis